MIVRNLCIFNSKLSTICQNTLSKDFNRISYLQHYYIVFWFYNFIIYIQYIFNFYSFLITFSTGNYEAFYACDSERMTLNILCYHYFRIIITDLFNRRYISLNENNYSEILVTKSLRSCQHEI